MSFNSFPFYLFFLLTILSLYFAKGKNSRAVIILISNLLFYTLANSYLTVLLLISIILNYSTGISLNKAPIRYRKLIFVCSLCINILILIFFNYLSFVVETTNLLLGFFNITQFDKVFTVLLPIGISFYTFQNISYIIDVYWKKINAEKNILHYSVYISFFPTVFAGPIVRAKTFLPQLTKSRKLNWQVFHQGFFLISFGLFLKVVIADNLAPYVERVFDYPFHFKSISAWIGTYSYALQVYFDFSGYSNIAIGVALILGFKIPENFNCPYAAHSFTDFWRRWHITLSSWIRDYLFLPCSYYISRKLPKSHYFQIKTEFIIYSFSIILAMSICGLWHGPKWNFVFWGILHGLYLIVERVLKLFKKPKTKFSLIIRRIVIFHFICLAWVAFRAGFENSLTIYQSLFGFTHDGVEVFDYRSSIMIAILLVLVLIIQYSFANNSFQSLMRIKRIKLPHYAVLLSLMWIAIITLNGKNTSFIYFQF
jgi:alginate O-acetyltransferase complex protein AlgI